jgi:hypothetical protein
LLAHALSALSGFPLIPLGTSLLKVRQRRLAALLRHFERVLNMWSGLLGDLSRFEEPAQNLSVFARRLLHPLEGFLSFVNAALESACFERLVETPRAAIVVLKSRRHSGGIAGFAALLGLLEVLPGLLEAVLHILKRQAACTLALALRQ